MSATCRRVLALIGVTLICVTSIARVSAAVELVDFAVEDEDDQVWIEWETATELNNAGFYVWRSTDADDEGDVIDVVDSDSGDIIQFVPARGDSVSGAVYEVIDENVENGTTYYYYLEDIDINGNSMKHVSDPPSVTVGEADTSEPTPTSTQTPTATSTRSPTPEPSNTATRSPTPEPSNTATEEPTATRTPQPMATDTPVPSATATSTSTPEAPGMPTNTRAPASPTQATTRAGAAQRESPTTASTQTPEEEDGTPTARRSPTPDAYPEPEATVPVTPTVSDETPTPLTSTLGAPDDGPPPSIQVPAAIVRPPSGFDLLTFFGRVLLALIVVTSISLVGVVVWATRSSSS